MTNLYIISAKGVMKVSVTQVMCKVQISYIFKIINTVDCLKVSSYVKEYCVNTQPICRYISTPVISN